MQFCIFFANGPTYLRATKNCLEDHMWPSGHRVAHPWARLMSHPKLHPGSKIHRYIWRVASDKSLFHSRTRRVKKVVLHREIEHVQNYMLNCMINLLVPLVRISPLTDCKTHLVFGVGCCFICTDPELALIITGYVKGVRSRFRGLK